MEMVLVVDFRPIDWWGLWGQNRKMRSYIGRGGNRGMREEEMCAEGLIKKGSKRDRKGEKEEYGGNKPACSEQHYTPPAFRDKGLGSC